ncbi:MAG: cation diffusion facilitator family transporter [Spirochaetaceae bacterium]|nr:cation diffusion facilitator family transporter [Spirochaetaceae bacterium]MDT8296676.1 cation diffusion facilitator family transporter [Spirochaetaceae bacterium]
MKINKRRIGYLEGGLSAVVNLVLFGFKFSVGRSIGSVAIVADAWHTLSDTLTSVIVVLGFWLSSRPKDREHPFGHGRAENIGSVVIGVLLAVVGFNFGKDAIHRLSIRQSVDFGRAAIIVTAASVITKELMAQLSIRMGRKFDSPSLLADGWHHRSDAASSALVLMGILFGSRMWWLDGALGAVVSILILYAAFEILRDSSRSILGEPPTGDLLERIGACRDDVAPELVDLHHIHIHRYGDHREVTLHARLPGNILMDEAHAASTLLEERLRKEVGLEATIHLEPLPHT